MITAIAIERSAHRHAEQQRRRSRAARRPRSSSSTSREITYDARYSRARHRRGDESLEQVLTPLIDDREAESPDAAAHDRHAEQTRDDEVDVARAALADVSLASTDSDVAAPGAALDRVVRPCSRAVRASGRVSSYSYPTPPIAVGSDDERDAPGAQRDRARCRATAARPPAPCRARSALGAASPRAGRCSPPRRARRRPACCETRCRDRSREESESRTTRTAPPARVCIP